MDGEYMMLLNILIHSTNEKGGALMLKVGLWLVIFFQHYKLIIGQQLILIIRKKREEIAPFATNVQV